MCLGAFGEGAVQGGVSGATEITRSELGVGVGSRGWERLGGRQASLGAPASSAHLAKACSSSRVAISPQQVISKLPRGFRRFPQTSVAVKVNVSQDPLGGSEPR